MHSLEGVEEHGDTVPKAVDGALGGLAEQGFKFGEELFDRIEIGRIRRQVEQPCAGGFDGLAYARAHRVVLMRQRLTEQGDEQACSADLVQPTIRSERPRERLVECPLNKKADIAVAQFISERKRVFQMSDDLTALF